ncbi:MAG: CAP domain-containing protein [Solirubrobacteraceae bacterium]
MIERNRTIVCHTVARPHAVIRRLATAFAAVLALTLVTLAPAASAHGRGCAHANAPIGAVSRPALQKAVVCLINGQRRSHGLPGLKANRRLDRSAQGWTNDMVSHRNFSHGADFSARISAVGFNWSNVGENIATGYRTPTSVVRAWMASTGHCQNILSPTFREVGTGLDDRSISGFSNAAGTWTQDFGLIMGQHPASGNWGPADGCPYG